MWTRTHSPFGSSHASAQQRHSQKPMRQPDAPVRRGAHSPIKRVAFLFHWSSSYPFPPPPSYQSYQSNRLLCCSNINQNEIEVPAPNESDSALLAIGIPHLTRNFHSRKASRESRKQYLSYIWRHYWHCKKIQSVFYLPCFPQDPTKIDVPRSTNMGKRVFIMTVVRRKKYPEKSY